MQFTNHKITNGFAICIIIFLYNLIIYYIYYNIYNILLNSSVTSKCHSHLAFVIL